MQALKASYYKKYIVKFKYQISYFPVLFLKGSPLTWETPGNRKPWCWVSQEKQGLLRDVANFLQMGVALNSYRRKTMLFLASFA